MVKIIAEIGNTHEGSLGLAKQFIKAAADCGVDCVKFQTHLFSCESLKTAPNPPYFKDETREEYFNRTAFDQTGYKKLKVFAEEECGVEFLSSPFSLEAVRLLEDIDLSAYKIPSGEVTNLPLLERVAETGKPVYLSSGMSSLNELDDAVSTLKKANCGPLTILQCTSAYPCPPEKAGLNLIQEFKDRYGLDVGFSDHTLGVGVPAAAVALGATVVEKHFTLSRQMYGSDAKNSTEPDEFKALVQAIRSVELALDHPVNKDEEVAQLTQMKHTFEKSVVAADAISAGTVLDPSRLAYKKPGDGINANQYTKIIGRKLIRDVEPDHVFSWSDFA